MKELYIILTLFIATNSFSQTNRKVSTFLSFQVNSTVHDRTQTNNSGGAGFGLQTFLNTTTRFKPTVEVNANLFAGTKEMYLTADERPIYAKSSVASVYIGSSFHLTDRLFIATTFGPTFYNAATYFGIRPSIGFYPSQSKKWIAGASFTNVYQRDDISNETFGYLSFALALKLF
ncbi:MAG: hypothetical protein ABI760_14810 [Ferruginibacter sp.]